MYIHYGKILHCLWKVIKFAYVNCTIHLFFKYYFEIKKFSCDVVINWGLQTRVHIIQKPTPSHNFWTLTWKIEILRYTYIYIYIHQNIQLVFFHCSLSLWKPFYIFYNQLRFLLKLEFKSKTAYLFKIHSTFFFFFLKAP